MSGVGEASLVLGIISSIIAIVTAAKNIYDAANDTSGLPKAFHKVAAKLPIVVVILKQADDYIHTSHVDQDTQDAFKTILRRCETSATELREIFQRVVSKGRHSILEKYISAAKKIGKGGRVEDLIAEVLKEISLLLACSSFATQKSLQAVEKALEDVSSIEPSLPADFSTSLPNRVNSGNSGHRIHRTNSTIQTLQEIEYQNHQADRDADPKAFLQEWLHPENLPVPKLATEQELYLQKRFHNPETTYTSCQWVFETQDYRKFVEADSSTVLRINGSSGCGKSVLTASIIHKLVTLYPEDDSSKVLYCYCSRDPEQTSSISLVRTLLSQAVSWASPEMVLEIKTFHSDHAILDFHDSSKVESGLWRLLRAVLRMATHKTYIVVDGLDKCAQPLICVRSLIRVATSLAAKAQCGLLISSRLQRQDAFDDKSIRSSLTNSAVECLQLDISREVTQRDLKEFVSYQVSTRSSFVSSSQEIRDRIITSVCNRAGGMFLYANLVLEDLKGETISSIADIDITLGNLPDDLSQSYERSFQIPRRARRGPETFRWIFCANPGLNWHELKSALAIGESGYDDSQIILDSCDVFIEHSCGQLVEAFGNGDRLRFIHPTVSEFLVRNISSHDVLNVKSGDSMIAEKLLTFLEYTDLPSFSAPITQSPEQTIQEYTARTGRGLYPFAILNWHKHLKKCDKSENLQLELRVRRFLQSEFFIRWLKTAVIMSRVFRDGRDSTSLTTDVVDSLQSWISGRSWSLGDSEATIQTWIKQFLDMMLDWGKVIETQPDWIHFLHQQSLSTDSCFRDILEESDNDQSIVQFTSQPVQTKRSEKVTWPSRYFAMDQERDLAFTYDEPFICSYHIKTGLLAAEILVPVPPKTHGPLVVRRGLLCPSARYLAVLFEATGPTKDPIGTKIRDGRRLHLNNETTAFKWAMDDASVAFDLSGILAHMAVGVDSAEFVVCLLEICHSGPARTHMFGNPSWSTNPILITGTQTMRWELDDVDVLRFSEDSARLATAFGIFDLETGAKTNHWQFALGQLYQGGKLTGDLQTFVTVLRDIDGDCIIQFFGIDRRRSQPQALPSREIRFKGVIHLLAISNHGRFLLLTRRDIVEETRKTKSRKAFLPIQQATIGVWDCRDGEWTPLLLLDRDFLNKLPHWKFSPYIHEPCFGPEAMIESEVNRVFISVPSRWKLSGNVRKQKPLNPGEGHLLIFESKMSTQGFGRNPVLKLQLHAPIFSFEGSEGSPAMKLLCWDQKLDTATIFDGISVVNTCYDQLRLLSLSDSVIDRASAHVESVDLTNNSIKLSSIFMSPTGSAAFSVQISVCKPNLDIANPGRDSEGSAAEFLNDSKPMYEISVACLLAGDDQARSFSVAYSPPPATFCPLINHQYACAADESSISLGVLELEISHEYENMSFTITDPSESILQRAIECFMLRAHPFEYAISDTSAVGFLHNAAAERHIIYTKMEMKFEDASTSEEATNSFVVKGQTSTEDTRHVFQVSRRLNGSPNKDREAGQFEICLFIYDKDVEDITWMVHTTTGGDISGSRERVPETSWALHGDLSLFAWLLPGHRLRISNIESHEAPITTAESLIPEVDSAQAMSFSPQGRYLLVRAQENFKNDLCSLRKSSNLWGAVICDLQEGRTTAATLISESPVSMGLDDDFLHTYRLTRDGAVESTTYALPGLTLATRQYLTFIPAGCRCSSCGKELDSHCNVSIVEHEEGIMAILGHTALGLGRALISNEVCQPLMIRITTPPVELKIEGVRESVFAISSIRLFPTILDDSGEIIQGVFTPQDDPRETCVKNKMVECFCNACSLESVTLDGQTQKTWIPQTQTNISDFELPSGLAVPPEQIEELHLLSEKAALKDTCIFENSHAMVQESVDRMKIVLGDEGFPWDTWAEFKEAMEEIKEVFDHEEYMKRLFEPGNCGAGARIPLFIYTFHFGGRKEGNDFHWSSATTTGWLEEDLEWYYERFFGGSFDGARRWYEFPAYFSLGLRMEKLQQDQTAKGKRFRKYFGEGVDKQGKILDIELPKKGKDVFERDGMKFGDDMKPMVPGLILKDVFESMSDLVPGLGKVFEQRLHTMLNQSLIEDLME